MESRQAIRIPDVVIRVLEQRLRLNDVVNPRRIDFRRGSGYRNVEEVFGLGHLSTMDYPESAFQGPFLNLLTYHPERGIDLLLRFINYCCTGYATAIGDIIEPPFQTALTLETAR